MELSIKDLVSSIKKDGIEEAEREAERIISEAKVKAEQIVADAKKEAKAEKEKADSDIALIKESAALGIEHAKRDAVLSFKKEVEKEFEKLLNADTEKTVKGETLAKLIKAALSGENPSAYAVEVAEVSEALKGEMADSIEKGLEIRASENVKVGFRIAAKDGSGYFDCSDEEIAEMLKPFFPEISI